MHINPKGKDGFSVVLPTKWIMVCEQLPTFSSKTDGFWQRLVIVPFNVPCPPSRQLPPEQLLEQLRPEYPGIFQWAMSGLLRLLKRGGTRATAFTRSATSNSMAAQHRVFSNPILSWIEERVEKDEDNHETRAKAYADYRMWSSQRGEKPLTMKKFHRQLVEAGFETSQPAIDGKRPHCWRGLRLVV